jgi:hypothetical protein
MVDSQRIEEREREERKWKSSSQPNLVTKTQLENQHMLLVSKKKYLKISKNLNKNLACIC